MTELEAKTLVIQAGKKLVSLGLVSRTWGNVSCRIDEKKFAITPSGIDYERLTEQNIVVVDIETLDHQGDVKPSSEKGVHAYAYKADPATNFVIHTHQTYATCITVAGFDRVVQNQRQKEILGEIKIAKYALPGTKKLASNVNDQLATGCKTVLLEKHGALLVGADMEQAFLRAVTLEQVCKTAYLDFLFCEDYSASVLWRDDKAFYTFMSDDVDTKKELEQNQAELSNIEAVQKALAVSYPEYKFIGHRDTDVTNKVSNFCANVAKVNKVNKVANVNKVAKVNKVANVNKIDAVLDDFAQIVGEDIKVVSVDNINSIVKAAKKRNAVIVKDIGVFALSNDVSDVGAILTLVEKNLVAFLGIKKYGVKSKLSLIDKKLMRFVYRKKYSKKK